MLSFASQIRYRLARGGALLSTVLAAFLRVVRGCYRRLARDQCYPDGRCGSVTLVQRFGSSIIESPSAQPQQVVFRSHYISGCT